MLGRNWLHNLALRGCLIAAALCCASALNAQENTQQQDKATPTQETQNSAAQPLAVIISGPVSLEREKPVETNWNEPKCGAAQSHDEADLCEQRKMAEAAHDTVWWTRAGVLIGAIGTVFLIWNLHYVRRSADAASEANRVARESQISEHRAWIFVKLSISGDLTYSRSGGFSVEVKAEISNIGQTPALYVHTAMDVCLSFEKSLGILKEFCAKNRTTDLYASRALLTGDSYVLPWNISMEESDIETGRLGDNLTPIIYGCVTYQLVQDESLHQTAFAYGLVQGSGDDFDGLLKVGEDVDCDDITLHVRPGGFAD